MLNVVSMTESATTLHTYCGFREDIHEKYEIFQQNPISNKLHTQFEATTTTNMTMATTKKSSGNYLQLPRRGRARGHKNTDTPQINQPLQPQFINVAN